MLVENLSYVVVEGVGDKRNFEREECVVSVGFLFWLFCLFLHALSVRRLGYPLRLSFVCVIEIASGLCASEEHSVVCLSSFVMIAFLTVRGWCVLKCRVIYFDAFFRRVCGESVHCRQFSFVCRG